MGNEAEAETWTSASAIWSVAQLQSWAALSLSNAALCEELYLSH